MTGNQWVDAGARALDVAWPGWHEIVEPSAIDLSSERLCVLGQLFGTYEAGLSRLGLTRDEGPWFGFESVWVGHWIAAIDRRSSGIPDVVVDERQLQLWAIPQTSAAPPAEARTPEEYRERWELVSV